MSFKHIISRDNPVFKQLKKLADNARERRLEGKTLLDGVHLIEAYIATFGEPELVIFPEGKSSVEATGLIQQLVDVATIMLPTLMFAELTPVVTATGILALSDSCGVTELLNANPDGIWMVVKHIIKGGEGKPFQIDIEMISRYNDPLFRKH